MAQITASVRAYAIRQERHQSAVWRSSDVFVRRFAGMFTKAARRVVSDSRTLLVKDLELEPAIEDLTDLMELAYLSAIRVSRSRRRQQNQLELSYVRVAVRKAADALDIDMSRLRPQFRSTAGQLVKGSTQRIRSAINEEIRDAVKKGVTVRTAVRRVTARMAALNAVPKNPNYIATLVRTATSNAYNGALYTSTISDPTVWGFQYVTMQDDKVRPAHVVLDGMTRRRDDPIWQEVWPPNGWNCRCQVVPLRQPARQTRIPKDIDVDDSFRYSAGELILN